MQARAGGGENFRAEACLYVKPPPCYRQIPNFRGQRSRRDLNPHPVGIPTALCQLSYGTGRILSLKVQRQTRLTLGSFSKACLSLG